MFRPIENPSGLSYCAIANEPVQEEPEMQETVSAESGRFWTGVCIGIAIGAFIGISSCLFGAILVTVLFA